jgi:hypothetical protein
MRWEGMRWDRTVRRRQPALDHDLGAELHRVAFVLKHVELAEDR